jgi:hypothetical protein
MGQCRVEADLDGANVARAYRGESGDMVALDTDHLGACGAVIGPHLHEGTECVVGVVIVDHSMRRR